MCSAKTRPCGGWKSRIAEMLGKEAALFVPSGTMGNQLGVRVHCQAGDEFLCESNCHILFYEQGAYAQLFGIAAQPVDGDHGVLRVEQLVDRIRPATTITACARGWCAWRTRTTAGRGGCSRTTMWWKSAAGRRTTAWRGTWTARGCSTPWWRRGISAADWAGHFDTISVCFSKGLGAPVGSALVGPADLIRQARRHRKALGGGMRQAGIIAAGALYALEHNIERLAEDHQNARMLADAVRATPGLKLDPETVDTNIVIFEIDAELGTAAAFSARLRDEGVLMNANAPQRLRAVTHLDVSARASRVRRDDHCRKRRRRCRALLAN